VNQAWKVCATVALVAAGSALVVPASWVKVSAGSQPEPQPVVIRAALNEGGETMRSGAVVVAKRTPAADIPEELSLLLVGAALVSLAGVLRRSRRPESRNPALRRVNISGVPSRASRPPIEAVRRSS
jgi:hypothetical protein